MKFRGLVWLEAIGEPEVIAEFAYVVDINGKLWKIMKHRNYGFSCYDPETLQDDLETESLIELVVWLQDKEHTNERERIRGHRSD